MSGKLYLKDKLEDDELDLSMMQLTEIPVKEIEQLGNKVLKLNLSHNLLSSVPANLPLLTQLTNLDLSKNQIVGLPENFGQLTKLKSLDLYSNKISKLPVSFAQLKSLKWLDLKENPLVPELAKAAGPCLTKTDCELAAKKVVARLQSIESQLFQEKKKQIEMEEKARRQRERKEEAERERIRQEKKLAKEKRREEARLKDVEARDQVHEQKVAQENGGTTRKQNLQNGHFDHEQKQRSSSGFSCLGFLFKLILFFCVGCVALSISLLWLYTDGKMDSDSIQRAVPVIQKDVERNLGAFSQKTSKYYKTAEKAARPYLQSAVKKGGALYEKVKKSSTQGYKWLESNYGESVRGLVAKARELMKLLWRKCQELAKNLMPILERGWSKVRPHLQNLGKVVMERCMEIWAYLQANFPVYVDWLTVTGTSVYKTVQTTVQSVVQALSG